MTHSGGILALADALVEHLASTEKVAATSEPVQPQVPQHPVAAALKLAAAALRAVPDGDVTLADVHERFSKIAVFARPGTGAQAPGAGSGVGSAQPAPSIPTLQTSNLGVTAGAGGAPMTMKAAHTPLGNEIRKVAQHLRDSDATALAENAQRADHVLNAARGLCYLQAGLRA